MEVHAVRAPIFDATCLVLSGDGRHALVIDPGAGAAAQVAEVVAASGLTVAAVALTHGHPDHVWDAAEVAGGAPVYVGAPDVHRLDDPAAALGPQLGPHFAMLTRTPWCRPEKVLSLGTAGERAELVPGLFVTPIEAPGHTEGSTVLLVDGPVVARGPVHPDLPEAETLVVTGDVIFAGSIGRTDLPGGDAVTMAATLRQLAATLPPDAPMVPGHGDWTTLSHERLANPYLRQAISS